MLPLLLRDFRAYPVYKRGWSLYADDQSRKLYVRLLVQRLLGSEGVSLPLDSDAFWRNYDLAVSQVPVAPGRQGGMGFMVPIYDLRPFGFDMVARCRGGGILAHCLLKQYELHRDRVDVSVGEGDVVIDGGAAWGDTALIFSAQAGTMGKVVSLECVDEVLELFRENMSLNPALAGRIQLVNAALWNVSNETVSFADNGPGSRVVTSDTGDAQELSEHRTISIDDLVLDLALPRVDFIKMDIEGSELAALQGAVHTLSTFRPKLALSAYHRPLDIIDLANYLSGLHLGYRFYLDHFTDHLEETVLFAVA